MDDARMREDIARLTPLDMLIGETVDLDSGTFGWRGTCPFHPDPDSALHVHRHARAYLCYACRRNGDAVRWLMERDQTTEAEALLILAHRAGIAPDC